MRKHEKNKLSCYQFSNHKNKHPAIMRSLRFYGGNTEKWSAEALQHIFWYECMVGKWNTDLSKEHLIQALKVVVTNANDLIAELKNTVGTIFPKTTLQDNRKVFHGLQRKYIQGFLRDPKKSKFLWQLTISVIKNRNPKREAFQHILLR